MVRTVTNGMAFAPGFAMSGLEGSALSAAAMWRPTAAAMNSAVVDAAGNPAQHQTLAISQKLATLHTQKQYVVTTPNTGRGNKGTSPWGFPV